jgi:Fe-S-cluster containining protein
MFTAPGRAGMYKYVEECTHCGDCCETPGMLLPEQIDVLARHFNMTGKELFDHYLIIQMWAPTHGFGRPDDCVAPVFVVSPVRAKRDGNRFPQMIYDLSYSKIHNLHCIFRDMNKNRCSIHEIKPFECTLTACPRMTKDRSIYLGKSFYYHKWKDSQALVFSVYPELRPMYKKLKKNMSILRKSFELRNRVMNEEIATIFNGNPREVPICI